MQYSSICFSKVTSEHGYYESDFWSFLGFGALSSCAESKRGPASLPPPVFPRSLSTAFPDSFAEAMAQYDLTAKVAPYLDRHLVFPLLEFLQDKQMYADDQILKAKIELLAKTNMVDYAMDIHKSLYHTEDVPQGMPTLYFALGCYGGSSELFVSLGFM